MRTAPHAGYLVLPVFKGKVMIDLEKKIRFVVDQLHDREHEVSLQNVWSSLHTIYGDKVRNKITRDEVNKILIKPKRKRISEVIIPLKKAFVIHVSKPSHIDIEALGKACKDSLNATKDTE